MTSMFGGQDRRVRSFANAAVVGLLLLLTAGCGTIQAEREATEAAMQPFDSNAENAVVLISVEDTERTAAIRSRSDEENRNSPPGSDDEPEWMYQLKFVSLGAFGEGGTTIEHTLTYMPITSWAYETSYGVKKGTRYYFLFRIYPGTYRLQWHNFFNGFQMFGEKLPEGGVLTKTLEFYAKKGAVNYAGNLRQQGDAKDRRIVRVVGVTREIEEAKSVLAESFPHVQAELRDAQTPNSIVGPSVVWLHGVRVYFH